MSFNGSFTNANSAPFPTEAPAIAAFWTTSSVKQVTASWEYIIINDSNGAGVIDHIKEYLKSKNIELNVTLVVAARWESAISSKVYVHWYHNTCIPLYLRTYHILP